MGYNYLFIITLDLLNRAHLTRMRQYHRIIINNLSNLLMRFRHLNMILLLSNSITLRTRVLNISRHSKSTLSQQMFHRVFNNILRVTHLRMTSAHVILNRITQEDQAMLFSRIRRTNAINITFRYRLVVQVLLLGAMLDLNSPLNNFNNTENCSRYTMSRGGNYGGRRSRGGVHRIATIFLRRGLDSIRYFTRNLLLNCVLLYRVGGVLF